VIPVVRWTERTWSFGLPIGAFPTVLERLRGTPVRAADLVANVDETVLRTAPDHSWSAKQHLGHLDDLHELDERRLGEFLAGATTLSAADMTNRRTYDADHNATPTVRLLDRLRVHRLELVARMEQLTESQVAAAATHPRLRQSVRLIDWAQFVAEHDDHHLASARQTIQAIEGGRAKRA
jgi:hypothetical protein